MILVPKNLALTVLGLAASISMSFAVAPEADAAQCKELAPEVVSRCWVEGDRQVAAVTVNGDELARFSSDIDDDDAAEEAEELAVKIQEFVADRKLDASKLIPARDDRKTVLKYDGNTIISFESKWDDNHDDANEIDSEPERAKKATKAFETGLRLCNTLRLALGASSLPSSFPDLSEKVCNGKLEFPGQSFSGQASWYGGKFHGRKCSNGSIYDMEKMTAAHRSLPFGTKLLVMNRRTGDQCVVEVNDRGPFIDGRVIDLSRAAARQLNMVSSGVAFVDCMVIGTN